MNYEFLMKIERKIFQNFEILTPFTNHVTKNQITRSFVVNGGGGPAAMLDQLRDRLPYNLGCALCPLSYPSGLYSEETSDKLLNYYTPPETNIGIYFNCKQSRKNILSKFFEQKKFNFRV